MKKIVGFKKGTSKYGNVYCFVNVTEAVKEETADCVGLNAFAVGVFGDDVDKIDKTCIGKELCGFFGYGQNGHVSVQGLQIK